MDITTQSYISDMLVEESYIEFVTIYLIFSINPEV